MKFIIGSKITTDGEIVYWSNDDGWVDQGSATVFDIKHVNYILNLPIDAQFIRTVI